MSAVSAASVDGTLASAVSGVRLSRAFDLVAKLSVHLSSSFDLGSYVSPTIGVRMRLP